MAPLGLIGLIGVAWVAVSAWWGGGRCKEGGAAGGGCCGGVGGEARKMCSPQYVSVCEIVPSRESFFVCYRYISLLARVHRVPVYTHFNL